MWAAASLGTPRIRAYEVQPGGSPSADFMPVTFPVIFLSVRKGAQGACEEQAIPLSSHESSV